MPKVSDIKLRHPKILLYGAGGCGKTSLVETAGDLVEILDLDKSAIVGLGIKDDLQKQRLNANLVGDVPHHDPIGNDYLKARDTVNKVCHEVRLGKYPYKIFCLDSFTSLMDGIIRHVKKKNNKLPEEPLTQAMWGQAFSLADTLLLQLRNVPLCVIITAHRIYREFEGVNRIMIGAPGDKFIQRLPTYFDEQWFMEANTVGGATKRTLQTQAKTTIEAKTRFQLPNASNPDKGLLELFKDFEIDFDPRTYTGPDE
jgi:hypothetical protein